MSDLQLPRIVAVGLFILALVSVVLGSALRLKGVDGSPVEAIAASGIGALAGFFAGAKFNTTES